MLGSFLCQPHSILYPTVVKSHPIMTEYMGIPTWEGPWLGQ
jgi:hypothetical protein